MAFDENPNKPRAGGARALVMGEDELSFASLSQNSRFWDERAGPSDGIPTRDRGGAPARPRLTQRDLVRQLPDVEFITPLDGSRLFRKRGDRIEPVTFSEAKRLGIGQRDIAVVNTSMLRLASRQERQSGGRAVGREVYQHLRSDLKYGHFLETNAWLNDRRLAVNNVIETHTWFGGWTGGTQIALFDANGQRINHGEIKFRHGQDGTAFSSGRTETSENPIDLPPEQADPAESMMIFHYWDPKSNIVQTILDVAQFIVDCWNIYHDLSTEGEGQVSMGGDVV